MVTGCHPSPADTLKAVEVAESLREIMRADTELGSYWLSVFERESGKFNQAWAQVVTESKDAIEIAAKSSTNGSGAERYAMIIDRLGLRKPSQRGSGVLTAVAATALTWCVVRPEEALRVAANAIGTDTDTIATMAGAIMGVMAASEPPVEVLDVNLFRAEADRLADIAHGGQPQGHDYPDLLHWIAPRTRSDAVTLLKHGGLSVRGLGRAEAKSEPIPSPRSGFMWQWLELELGQTLLIKRRAELILDEDDPKPPPRKPVQGPAVSPHHDPRGQREDSPQKEMSSHTGKTPLGMNGETQPERTGGLNLQRALDYIRDHKADDKIVGKALRRVVIEGTPGEIAGFTAGLIEIIRQYAEVPRSAHHRADHVSGERETA
jgi:hypothetical protein